jgi:TonB family protein
MLVEAAFWFYPLVWWIGARLIEERERACDETVVRSGHDRATYAEGILRVCELCIASPLSCAAGVSGADLKKRVTEIMRSRPMRKLSVSSKGLFVAAAAAALLVPIAAGLVSGGAAFAQNRPDLVPLVRIAPNYPEDALVAGLDGVVKLMFTITTTGTTKDIVVIESSYPSFEQAAITALSRWRYQPQSEAGQPVEVRGMQTVISFKLERGPPPSVPGSEVRPLDQTLIR